MNDKQPTIPGQDACAPSRTSGNSERFRANVIDRLRSELSEANQRIAELTIEADRHVEEITALRNEPDDDFVLPPSQKETKVIGKVISEEELAAKDARIAELEAGLKPFATGYEHFAWADNVQPFRDDHVLVSLLPGDSITVGHLRSARSTLEGIAELETEDHDEPERIASIASGCIPADTFIRLRDWLSSEPRKAACNAFTAGIERQLAYVIERSGILEQGE